MKYERKEFEGNILVTMSDNEVRLWVCNETGNIFRFKAIGQVHKHGQDITILPLKKAIQPTTKKAKDQSR